MTGSHGHLDRLESLWKCEHHYNKTRKKRNEYIDHSTIPKDDEDTILTYMRKSLGVLTVFLDKEFSFDLYQSIFFPPLKQNFKVARNIAKTHSGEGLVSYSMSIF